jgi:ferredoxin
LSRWIGTGLDMEGSRIDYFSRESEVEPFKIKIKKEDDIPRKGVIEMAYVIGEECVACGTCFEECPVDAIQEGEPHVINEEKCTDCGSCSEVCPVEAIVQK